MTSAAAAHLLVVDDDPAFRSSLVRELVSSGFRVDERSTGAEVKDFLKDAEPDVVLLDLRLAAEDGLAVLQQVRAQASSEIIVLTGHGTVQSAIKAMKLGAADYLQKPCDLDELELAIERALETRRLKERNAALERGLARGAVEMIGRSERFLRLQAEIESAARSRANVLIAGESGAGKELVARRLHQASPARDKPLVVVDCASLSDELMHSELFGHERGAFTGAAERKPGLFEMADGGTLYLDEIGEVTPRVQARLLRVLETGTFRRMGGTRELRVDVRVVSATNRRLEEVVRQGTFREDLYYRLIPLTIAVPPLRERREDIPLMVAHFIARAARSLGTVPAFDETAMRALCAWHWPGNVRELIGAVERLLVFRATPVITEAEVRSVLQGAIRPAPSPDESVTLSTLEQRHIEAVMRRCGGHRAEAAKALGVSERTLYRKLRVLGLTNK